MSSLNTSIFVVFVLFCFKQNFIQAAQDPSADNIGIHSTLPQNPFETRAITIIILKNITGVEKIGIF